MLQFNIGIVLFSMILNHLFGGLIFDWYSKKQDKVVTVNIYLLDITKPSRNILFTIYLLIYFEDCEDEFKNADINFSHNSPDFTLFPLIHKICI